MTKGGNKGHNNQKGAHGGGQPSPPEKCRFGGFPQVQAVRIEPSSEDNKRYSNEQTDRTKQLELSSDLNLITAIAAGVSFFALLALFCSIILTKKALTLTKMATDAATSQAQTAKNEYELSQRPWVSVRVVQVGKLHMRGSMLYISPTMYEAKNSGHSIAANFSYHAYIVMFDKENGKECDGPANYKPRGTYPFGTVIFPENEAGGSMNAMDFTGNLDEEFRISPTPGAITPRLVACVVYTSPVDEKPHYTRVVYWVYHHGTQNPNFTRDAESYDIDIDPDINGSTAN